MSLSVSPTDYFSKESQLKILFGRNFRKLKNSNTAKEAVFNTQKNFKKICGKIKNFPNKKRFSRLFNAESIGEMGEH